MILDNFVIGRMDGRLEDIKALRKHVQDLIESYEFDLNTSKETIAKLNKQIKEMQARSKPRTLNSKTLNPKPQTRNPRTPNPEP